MELKINPGRDSEIYNCISQGKNVPLCKLSLDLVSKKRAKAFSDGTNATRAIDPADWHRICLTSFELLFQGNVSQIIFQVGNTFYRKTIALQQDEPCLNQTIDELFYFLEFNAHQISKGLNGKWTYFDATICLFAALLTRVKSSAITLRSSLLIIRSLICSSAARSRRLKVSRI